MNEEAREYFRLIDYLKDNRTIPAGTDLTLSDPVTRWSLAHTAAMLNILPKDFVGWNLRTINGLPVAFVAAGWKSLPPDFDRWDITYNKNTVAHHCVLCKSLPKDFSDWGLLNELGDTVAHLQVRHGWLPEDFDAWELVDARGVTVAHEAVTHGKLPKSFTRWDIRDTNGTTIGHIYAKRYALPEDFNGWFDEDGSGVCVARVAAKYNTINPSVFHDWDHIDGTGQTIEAAYLRK